MIKNENEPGVDPFKVYVRVRPLLERELTGEVEKFQHKSAVVVEDNLVKFHLTIIGIFNRSRKQRTIREKRKMFHFCGRV
jgi:hypothetical protein